ncbi:MAG: aconitase X catalytic domain-containing protein, partial [Candidatus Bathyarchaeia archaeon]
MHLTREEEKLYNGEYGWAYQVAMKILVRLGDLFGATRLIPIQSSHISGVSYKHMGDASIDFLQAIADADGKARVFSTLNPSSFDPKHLVKKFPQNYLEKQKHIVGLYEKIGATPTLTCTPYHIHKPLKGQHIAWAESSAVVYANSVLGAWTNREGSPSALAAALAGKTPNYGIHQAENRQPSVLVKVEAQIRNEAEYGALGIYLGKLLRDKIPVFESLPKQCSEDGLKNLGAGLASSGMTAMFYRNQRPEKERLETMLIEPRDIKEAVESLCTTTQKPDLIYIGCPHCSLEEVREVAMLLRGKKVRKGVKLWVCTSRYVREKAKNHVRQIEKAGGRVLCDTCAVV